MYHTLVFVFFASSVLGAMQDRQPSKLSAQQCPDGLPGIINQLQAETLNPFQPAIYITDCSPHRNDTRALPSHHNDDGYNDGRSGTAAVSRYSKHTKDSVEKRAINMCSAGCLNACSWSSSGPSSSDCSALANYISSRGSSFTVDGWQKITATSGTCMTTFLNLDVLSVTWCDSTWASQSSGLAGSCSTGGTCFGTLFEVTTETNPDYTPPVNTPTPPPASTPPNTPTTPNSPATLDQGNGPSSSSGNANNNGNGNTATSTAIRSTLGSTDGANSVNTVSSKSGSNADTATGEEGVRFYTSSIPITTLSNGAVVGLSGTVTFGANPSATCSTSNSSCSDGHPTSIVTNAKPKTLADNPGAIAGIIIGIVLLMGIFVFFMCWRRRRNRVGQTIIVGPLDDEEKERPEVEVISEPRSPSDRAYTISSTGFGRVLEHSSGQSSGHSPQSPHSPQLPHSPASRNSVMSSGMGESRISYVPFWDMLRGEQKGTISDLGLDNGERTSESSCYSNEQRKLGQPISRQREDARLSSHIPEGQDRRLVLNPDPVQSVRASTEDLHGDRSKSDSSEAYATPLSYPSVTGSPTVALLEPKAPEAEGTS